VTARNAAIRSLLELLERRHRIPVSEIASELEIPWNHATGLVGRVWRAGLIAPPEPEGRRARRLQPGERLGALTFVVTQRGRDRLAILRARSQGEPSDDFLG
jgi:hypothetical protein